MKVFGIGLNKTGTTSLGKALEILGYNNHISCRADLTKKWSENDIASILEKAKEFNNFEDWPWPLIYKELYEKFDDAKFILTKRATVEQWYNSLCKHSLRRGPSENRKLVYGYYMPHDFITEHFDIYNKHNQDVVNYFEKNAPEKLLVISFEEGNNWEKLCKFLNKDIPKTDFPFLNRAVGVKPPPPINNHLQLTIHNKLAIRLINAGREAKKLFIKK